MKLFKSKYTKIDKLAYKLYIDYLNAYIPGTKKCYIYNLKSFVKRHQEEGNHLDRYYEEAKVKLENTIK